MATLPVPFVGPSYQLANRKADVQRTVNMYPQRVESGSGKAQFILKSVAGLTELVSSSSASTREMRGMFSPNTTNNYVYCVIGNKVFNFNGSSLTALTGTLGSSGLAVIGNSGRLHIVFADGTSAYQVDYTAGSPTVSTVSDVSMPSPVTWAEYLAGRFIYGNMLSDQFVWSAIDVPDNIDALDFATAESAPDGIFRGIAYREELWLMGRTSTEVWRPSSSADAAFERNTGVSISVGCAAPASCCIADNSLFWLGQDSNGTAVVYKAAGYQPQRVSNHAIEEALSSAGAGSIYNARAFTYQENGQVFYCLKLSGVDTTLCYEVTTDSWHERAEFFNGDFSPWRVTNHVITQDGYRYFGGTLTGHPTDPDKAAVYSSSFDTYTFDGDTICRERTSPHYATPSLDRVFYPRVRLDCSVGTIVSGTKYVQLYYSNDGGYTWSNSALSRSLGETGDRRVSVQWNRLGSARDRVWKLRCTDDVLFDIVNVDVQAEAGTS